MEIYNWQKKEWPQFIYKVDDVENELYILTEKFGLLTGMLKAMPEEMQMDTILDVIVSVAIKP